MNLFWDFFDSRKEEKDTKHFRDVIHPPIICDDIENDTPVICLIPPPELYLLIEPVNKLDSSLENEWPGSETWLKACNIKKDEYLHDNLL